MDSNNIYQKHLAADLQLSEPHFEEEATLLSARRVVPLNEVKAEARSEKRWALGLAVLLAVVVGALGATVIYRQLGQKQLTGSKQASPEVPSQPGATSASDVTAPEAAENGGDMGRRDASNPGTSGLGSNQDAQVLPSAEPEKVTAIRQNVSLKIDDTKERRRAARTKEAQLRSKSERDGRTDARKQKIKSDDLLRIREIFEGAPRP